MKITTLLEKLITKKFYENKEEIENKLDIFYAMCKLNNEEYSNLTLKAEEVYAVVEEVIETEEEL